MVHLATLLVTVSAAPIAASVPTAAAAGVGAGAGASFVPPALRPGRRPGAHRPGTSAAQVPRPVAAPLPPERRRARGGTGLGPRPRPGRRRHAPSMAADEDDDAQACWNPPLRRTLAVISTLGASETAYLTYAKLFTPDGVPGLCGTDLGGACSSVLSGPYSSIDVGGTEVPLSAMGFAAYATVAGLSLGPLLLGHDSSAAGEGGEGGGGEADVANRLAILFLTTAMATFSSFLLSLLFGVLRASCPYCLLSAALSLSLGVLSWSGGMLPDSAKKLGARLGLGSAALTTAAALALFLSVDPAAEVMSANGLTGGFTANAAIRRQETDIPPPMITTHSTDRALLLAADLQSLDARMFGAYWCSHCYEQKQLMGMEAMAKITYVECSKNGLNSQNALCRERDVPGYPTWEVGGKLYPGEMELDELEDIVRGARGDR